MKKRFLAIILALALCMGLAIPAFAADDVIYYLSDRRGGIDVSTTPSDDNSFSLTGTDLEETGRIDYEAHQEPATFPIFTTSHPVTVTLTDGYTDGKALHGTNEDGDIFAVCEVMSIVVDQLSYDEETKEYTTVKEDVVPFDGTFGIELADNSVKENVGTLQELSSGKVTLAEDETPLIYKGAVGTISEPGLYHVQVWRPAVGACQAYVQILDNGTSDDTDPAAPAFTDVTEGAYYAAPVAWAVEKSITNGTSDTTFSPDQNCTQAQILTFLFRAAREEGTASAEDMELAVKWATEKGIIDDTFEGGKDCTRSTAVSYIWQAFESPEAEAADFTDVDAEAAYAAAVSWALANGITNGTTETTFGPDEVCSRGQIVTFLHRAYVEEARLSVK